MNGKLVPAFVELVDLENVIGGEFFSLPDGSVLLQWDDGLLPGQSEGGARVVR